MYLDVSKLVTSLNTSNLIAKCPFCFEEFLLSDSLLFDGQKKFPDKAEERKQRMLQELKDRAKQLLEQKQKVTTTPEKSAIAIGIGKIIEKILPAHKNFGLVSSDCRFLAEPIDMIIFEGLSENRIKHITFMDVKTGKSALNKHQRQIRDAIVDHDVRWRSF